MSVNIKSPTFVVEDGGFWFLVVGDRVVRWMFNHRCSWQDIAESMLLCGLEVYAVKVKTDAFMDTSEGGRPDAMVLQERIESVLQQRRPVRIIEGKTVSIEQEAA